MTFAFGTPGAGWLPIVGDWDEDGVDSVGLYDPATATFRLKYYNEPGAADVTFVFGPTGSVPVAGDWNGDGRDTIGVWIPSTGEWRLRNSNSAGAADYTFVFTALRRRVEADRWGLGHERPRVPGLYQPATGQFVLRKTNLKTSGVSKFNFGPVPGGLPLAGDWNGK